MDAPTPILQLSNHLIRPFYAGDVEAIAKEGNNPEIARWLRSRFPEPTPSKTPSRREDNIAIGSIGLKARDDVYYRTMEIGYWVGQDHWGKGIATEAISAMTAWAFENFAHVLKLEAEVYDGNEASQKVLVKAGYQFEGRRRKAVEKKGVVLDTLNFCTFRAGE
ncbi:acetyltransferase [Aspergillus bombycis]|uniref:Acetyltransferase n=1 Tax=Aspergillus bombycis TaxID=109264 RepID=A0A1F7ZPI0_9EURO|nr:acetyltransferase [Aspergillus bombycis]OGM41353.1 acetyltransferase [Aspergillus bombycis]